MNYRYLFLAIGLTMLFGLLLGFGCLGSAPTKTESGQQTSSYAGTSALDSATGSGAGQNNTQGTGAVGPACTGTGPVCGVDNKTYASSCDAANAEVSVAHEGSCVAPATCSDSDGGLTLETAGTTTKGSESHSDYCIDANQLVEYSCLDNSISLAAVMCGEGKECKDGKCSVKPASQQPAQAPAQNIPANTTTSLACTGPSEPNVYRLQNTTYNGTIYKDACVDSRTIKNYFCKDGKIASLNNQCPGGYTCTGSGCVVLEYTCSESDGGNDTLMRGRTIVMRGVMRTISESIDECIDDDILLEYFCNQNGTLGSGRYSCGSGMKCESGRCKRSSCRETDGGNNPAEKGTVTVNDENYIDDCVSGTTLREYFCYGDDVDYDDVHCGENQTCTNDACVPD